MDKVVIVPGRFQPFHRGHAAAIDLADTFGHMVFSVIVQGKVTGVNRMRNPFNLNTITGMMQDLDPYMRIATAPTGYMPDIVKLFAKEYGAEVTHIVCGADRVNTYAAQFERATGTSEFTGNVPSFACAPRITSATQVREALRQNDQKTFEKLVMPDSHWRYDSLRNIINNPQE